MDSAVTKSMLLLPAILLLQGCLWGDDGIDACVADLTDNLKAPSTLKLVSAYRGEMPDIDHADQIARFEKMTVEIEDGFEEMTDSERYYLAYRKKVFIPEMKAKHDPSVIPSYSILLTYDAENSFGAPLRGHHWCWIAKAMDEEHVDSVFDAGSVSDEQAKNDKATMKEVSLPLF